MVDLTSNAILLENEANLADDSSDLAAILTHVISLLPEFMTAKVQGSGPYQINIVCKCNIGTNMGTLNVSELTRANIDTKVTEKLQAILDRCNNTCPDGYELK